MKYAVLYFLLSICLISIGLYVKVFGWLLIWFGCNCIIVGLAYVVANPKIFGKQANGRIASWTLCLLLPYLLITWAFWEIKRIILREECCHKIASGIWLGRRAFADELPENISLIIDLTAEFIEPNNVVAGKTYICVPTLDASVPPDEKFIELIETISSWQGNVYLHCALGHGRAATLAAGTLFAKGLVDDMIEAEKVLKQIRPSVSFSKVQKQLLNRVMKRLDNQIFDSASLR